MLELDWGGKRVTLLSDRVWWCMRLLVLEYKALSVRVWWCMRLSVLEYKALSDRVWWCMSWFRRTKFYARKFLNELRGETKFFELSVKF